jgi:hypothetical protein
VLSNYFNSDRIVEQLKPVYARELNAS